MSRLQHTTFWGPFLHRVEKDTPSNHGCLVRCLLLMAKSHTPPVHGHLSSWSRQMSLTQEYRPTAQQALPDDPGAIQLGMWPRDELSMKTVPRGVLEGPHKIQPPGVSSESLRKLPRGQVPHRAKGTQEAGTDPSLLPGLRNKK